MKILAAIMDISFVKYCGSRRQHIISRVKKFLVYDPRKVTIRHTEKEKEDE